MNPIIPRWLDLTPGMVREAAVDLAKWAEADVYPGVCSCLRQVEGMRYGYRYKPHVSVYRRFPDFLRLLGTKPIKGMSDYYWRNNARGAEQRLIFLAFLITWMEES